VNSLIHSLTREKNKHVEEASNVKKTRREGKRIKDLVRSKSWFN